MHQVTHYLTNPCEALHHLLQKKCSFNTLIILWVSTKHFRHLERSYLLLLCGIGYYVIKWSHCELKRDLLCFLKICNDIISPHN